jgi:hypothetical protein
VKKITSTHYPKDALHPKVSRAIAEILQGGEVVTPVEVFADFSGYLSRDDHPRDRSDGDKKIEGQKKEART